MQKNVPSRRRPFSKWENDISAPDISLLPALAELFGISCDELLGARPVVPKVIPEGLVDPDRILFRINIKSADGDVVSSAFRCGLQRRSLRPASSARAAMCSKT